MGTEVMGLLDKHKILVLATSADGRVTARSVSCVYRDHDFLSDQQEPFEIQADVTEPQRSTLRRQPAD